MVLGKHEIEAALYDEKQAISAGRLKEDSPLDITENFRVLCEACRRGDLKVLQEKITEGTNINARDRFDSTPLILASLCGHFEVVQLLLESGALCERDTFQGERCVYNALNDRIRNLLLSYDYAKSRDPLQPLAAHITSLLNREIPQTSDIILYTDTNSFRLHKFILSARSPYFTKKLVAAPETTSWKIPSSIPSRSLEIAILALYLGEVNIDFGTDGEDQAVLAGIEKLGRQLEIDQLLETILENDRRIARQRRTEEVERGRNQLDQWFQEHVLAHRMRTESAKADDVKWDRQNNIFADVLLCADEDENDRVIADPQPTDIPVSKLEDTDTASHGIPVGPMISAARSRSRTRKQSTLFPAHRAMLLRSEYFSAMFSSQFKEAQHSTYLPVVHVDCIPAVLTVILTYLYTERAHFQLDLAIDVLFVADLLFIEKLKVKAAIIISTLGNGAASTVDSANSRAETDIEDVVNIYDVVRAGWETRVPRLEEFGARYIAYRLERYVEEEEFRELVKESAARIQKRQETDTVELIDDIRYYLSERFRLRFEDAGLGELMDESTIHGPPPANKSDDIRAEESLEAAEISVDRPSHMTPAGAFLESGVVCTLDGEIAGDEFAQDALNYQILLGKIDTLLEGLKLEA